MKSIVEYYVPIGKSDSMENTYYKDIKYYCSKCKFYKNKCTLNRIVRKCRKERLRNVPIQKDK